MSTKDFAAPTAALGVTIVALASLAAIDVDWTAYRAATCMPAWCFCEAVGGGFVRQPANTWSNLGFVYVGYLILWNVLRAPRLPGTGDTELATPFRVAFGATLAFMGFGSWIYHASLTFVGQWFDVIGMYMLPTLVLLFHAQRHAGIGPAGAVAGYVALNALLGILLVVAPGLRRYLFAATLIAAAVVELASRRGERAGRDLRLFGAAAATLAVAFGIWILDLTHIVCWPRSLLQGHAVWHLLCAASGGLLYVYFRSERGT